MKFHQGRLIDHVHLRVRDLEASKRFYRAALEAVGLGLTRESESAFLADELYVSEDGEPTSRVHLAFQAPDRETVQRFYEAALEAGGRDNGRPGERGYHPGYFAAYVLDPDGNNVEAVFHGPTTRSAASVVVEPVAATGPARWPDPVVSPTGRGPRQHLLRAVSPRTANGSRRWAIERRLTRRR